MKSNKTNKTLLMGLVLAGTSVSVFAGHDDYEDRARVISVTPQFERVNTPRQECRTEYVRESYYEERERSNTGAIIGGISGGLIGSRFGGGSGRIATAAVGAGLGAIIGDRYDNNRQPYGRERVETRPVERCVTVDNWHQVPAGYLVNYEYNGRQYSTVTDQDPGRFVPVHVAVRPSGYVTDVVYKPGRDNHWRKGHGRGHDKHDRKYW
ncbi:MAG: glycine zipper 2TM domain-containing protein [Methylophilaceae bacterium]